MRGVKSCEDGPYCPGRCPRSGRRAYVRGSFAGHSSRTSGAAAGRGATRVEKEKVAIRFVIFGTRERFVGSHAEGFDDLRGMAGFQPLFFYASAELRCLMPVQLHEVEAEGFYPFLYIPDFRVDENAYATASLRQIVGEAAYVAAGAPSR